MSKPVRQISIQFGNVKFDLDGFETPSEGVEMAVALMRRLADMDFSDEFLDTLAQRFSGTTVTDVPLVVDSQDTLVDEATISQPQFSLSPTDLIIESQEDNAAAELVDFEQLDDGIQEPVDEQTNDPETVEWQREVARLEEDIKNAVSTLGAQEATGTPSEAEQEAEIKPQDTPIILNDSTLVPMDADTIDETPETPELADDVFAASPSHLPEDKEPDQRDISGEPANTDSGPEIADTVEMAQEPIETTEEQAEPEVEQPEPVPAAKERESTGPFFKPVRSKKTSQQDTSVDVQLSAQKDTSVGPDPSELTDSRPDDQSPAAILGDDQSGLSPEPQVQFTPEAEIIDAPSTETSGAKQSIEFNRQTVARASAEQHVNGVTRLKVVQDYQTVEDGAIDRLLETTNTLLQDEEHMRKSQSRERLKAAVAATEAERKISVQTPQGTVMLDFEGPTSDKSVEETNADKEIPASDAEETAAETQTSQMQDYRKKVAARKFSI